MERTTKDGLNYRMPDAGILGPEYECAWCGKWNLIRQYTFCPKCHHAVGRIMDKCHCFHCREAKEIRRIPQHNRFQYAGFDIKVISTAPGYTWEHPEADDTNRAAGFALSVTDAIALIDDFIEDNPEFKPKERDQ